MKKYSLLFFALLLMVSCTNEGNKIGTNDTTGGPPSLEAPLPPASIKRDSFSINLKESSFACTRSKTAKNVDKQIKIGNSTMNLKMDNASFTASTVIKIKSGKWFSLDSILLGGIIVLDMKSVSALQIGDDERIESGSPEYLEVSKYPISTLSILHFDSIPSNPKKMNVVCRLQLKDTTGEVIFPAKVEFKNLNNPKIPTNLVGDFHIDGMKWGLNSKNAKVIKDDLLFHIVLINE